jgi:hypothetical protein
VFHRRNTPISIFITTFKRIACINYIAVIWSQCLHFADSRSAWAISLILNKCISSYILQHWHHDDLISNNKDNLNLQTGEFSVSREMYKQTKRTGGINNSNGHLCFDQWPQDPWVRSIPKCMSQEMHRFDFESHTHNFPALLLTVWF